MIATNYFGKGYYGKNKRDVAILVKNITSKVDNALMNIGFDRKKLELEYNARHDNGRAL